MGTRQAPFSFWIKSSISGLASVMVLSRVGCVLAVLVIGGGLGLPLHDG